MFINVTALYLALLALGAGLILCGPRHYVVPVLLTFCVLVSNAPKLVLFDQNLMTHRLLLLCAWARVFIRGEYRGLKLQPFDKPLILFCLWTLIADTLLWGTLNSMIYQIANSLCDALGAYFLARVTLKDAQDFRRLLAALVGVCVVLAAFMSLEFVTGHNWLNAFGAFNEIVQVRQGRMRCQAAFSVPITAGTFGAVLLPLFVACWWQGRTWRKLAVAGCIASTIITLTAGSGGPVLTYVAGLVGLAAWQLRHRMRAVRWSILFGIIALHLVMKAPVWFLIARFQVVPGASSHHRAKIVDTFVKHIGDWWALGVQSTEDWGWEMEDVANQYCVVAKHGGLLALILFVRVLFAGFWEAGRRRALARDFPTEFLFWAFGVMLFAHAVSFIGISYFDQVKMLWFVSLAMLGSLHLLRNTDSQSFETPIEAAPSASASWVHGCHEAVNRVSAS
jgi:hypothetical protein